MSIKVTIEHGDGQFRRVLDIGRIADAEDVGQLRLDARHVYEVVISGGAESDRATFTHRYGDPLQVLFVEAVAALEPVVGRANRGMFDGLTGARR